MWYLYVNNVETLPSSIAQDYGRLGALIATAHKPSGDYPGTAWKEIDDSAFEDGQGIWDETTLTLIDSGSRFIVLWRDVWNRMTFSEQNNLFDSSQSNASMRRTLERFKISMADVEAEPFDIRGEEGSSVLNDMVSAGVITESRRLEIVGN
jgi:hypothetical protein